MWLFSASNPALPLLLTHCLRQVSGQAVALLLERCGVLQDLPPMQPDELFDERRVDVREGEEEEEEERRPRSQQARRTSSLTSRGSGSGGAMSSLRRVLSGRRQNQAHDWMRSLKAPDEHHRPLYDAPAFASDARRALPAAGCRWASEVVLVPTHQFAPWMSNARHAHGMPPLPRHLAEVLCGDREGRAFLRATRLRTEQERDALVQMARAARRGYGRGHRVAPAPEG